MEHEELKTALRVVVQIQDEHKAGPTAAEVSKKTPFTAKHTRKLLTHLVSKGLLTKEGDSPARIRYFKGSYNAGL